MQNNVLIVADSFEYRKKERRFIDFMEQICKPRFFYTQYETKLIRFFFNVPIFNSFLTHIAYWFLSVLYAIDISKLRKQTQNIIFINPIVGFFYSFFSLFLNNSNKILIAGFLFEPKKSKIYYGLRIFFVNVAYRKVNKIVVYSKKEKVFYQNLFPNLAHKFIYIPYGKDYDFFNKKEFTYECPYIASGGRSNRDYKILSEAYSLMAKEGFKTSLLIATRRECVEKISFDRNVIIEHNIPLEMFGSFISSSLFFVLPILDTTISAGHMAMLEAMSLKKIVLVADIPSIRDYVDESCVVFYKPNDPIDLSNQMKYILQNIDSPIFTEMVIKAYHLYESKYSFSNLLFRLAQCLN